MLRGIVLVMVGSFVAASISQPVLGQAKISRKQLSGANVEVRLYPVVFPGQADCTRMQMAALEQQAWVYASTVAPKAMSEVRARANEFRQRGIDPNDRTNLLRVDGGYGCSNQGTIMLRFPAKGALRETHARRLGEPAWRVTRQ